MKSARERGKNKVGVAVANAWLWPRALRGRAAVPFPVATASLFVILRRALRLFVASRSSSSWTSRPGYNSIGIAHGFILLFIQCNLNDLIVSNSLLMKMLFKKAG